MTQPSSRQAAPAPTPRGAIGVSRTLPAWDAGVRGETRYGGDEHIPGLLHARLVLSPYARAHVRGIDRVAALAMPGVVAVLDAADLGIAPGSDMRMFEPLAGAEIVFAGQPLAVVIAETEAAAADAVGLVHVDLEPLPEVLDPEMAMRPESPLARPRRQDAMAETATSMHAAVGTASGLHENAEALSANVSGQKHFREGDVAAALAASDVRVSGRFETGWMYQAYLEPHVATAIPTSGGGLQVRASTQGTHYTRTQLARILGLPAADIEVVGTPLGGAFGSKILVVEPIVAGAALRLGRPVRLALTRSEDMAMTNPAQAGVIAIEVGAKADGTLTALRARIVLDAGAYSEWSVEGFCAVLVGGPYRWGTFDVEAFGVETNHVGTGSYRGPGGPQSAFALESIIDELAEALSSSPVELRRRNLVRPGDDMIDGESWPLIGAAECLARLEEHPMWVGRDALPDDEGVGLAIASWPGAVDRASAVCRLESDGTLSVITGIVDMSGTTGSLSVIAAETFGVPVEQVRVRMASTDAAPRTPISGGSVITYAVGRAVRRAAEEARERLLAFAADEFEIAPSDLEIVDGAVRPRGAPQRAVSIADLAEAFEDGPTTHEPIEGHGPVGKPAVAPGTAGHLVHVAVDEATGHVRVLGHVVAQDVGRALNPALVRGQMQGAAAQALGWAISEELIFGENGELLTGSFLDYAVPHARMVPPIEALIVEVPAPDGPFGARGVGEASVCAGAAAVANAVAAAARFRPRRLPMTPPRVWEALQARDTAGARHRMTASAGSHPGAEVHVTPTEGDT